VRRHIDAEIAVEGIVVDGAPVQLAAVQTPNMNAIVVVGVRRRIPVGEVMEMVVVNAVVGTDTAGRYAMIDMINIGVFQDEVASISSDGPGGIMASDVVNRKGVGTDPINAMNGMGGS